MGSAATAQPAAASNTAQTPVMTERDRRELIKGRQRRRITFACAVSLVFHLSMITLFEIVLVFPREDMQYFEVSIVSSPGAAAPDDAVARRAGDQLALSGPGMFDDDLPVVDLPVIEFAELERLRIRYDAVEPLPALEGFFDPPRPTDSWARFGEELQRLGRSLRDLATPGDALRTDTPAPRHYLPHRPAEGFEAYVEWSGPPHDRELLFAPPVKALWRVNPDTLLRPLEIVFKVDPSGRVTNVWSPVIDDSGLLDDVQITVLTYRFAPLPEYVAGEDTARAEQSGVLFIRPAKAAP